MDRAGGVDANELDLDALATPEVGVAEGAVLFDDAVHLGLEPALIQREVHEARPCDPDLADHLGVGQGCDYRLAYGPGIHPHWTGEFHGEAAGVVAVLGSTRPFYRKVSYTGLRKFARLLSGVKRGSYVVGYMSSD